MNNQSIDESMNDRDHFQQHLTALIESIPEINESALAVRMGNELVIHNLYNFWQALFEFNKKVNLVADSSMNSFINRHIIDSIYVFQRVNIVKNTGIIDMGTGAGLPAIPVKIVFPEAKVIMIESRKKKCRFHKIVIEKLGLRDISSLNLRIEEAGRGNMRNTADLITSRAVAHTSVLIEYAMPLLKVGGKAIFYKGKTALHECEQSENALKELNASVIDCINYMLPYDEIERSMLIIEKTGETDKRYPRRCGVAAKRPLK